MKKMILSMCIVMVLVSGCSRKWLLAPEMFRPPDDAPEAYKLGWDHGCESGLSAYGNNLYKTFYSFQQDVSLMKDVMYSKAWLDSFNYCRARVNEMLRSGLWVGDAKADGGVSAFLGGDPRMNNPTADSSVGGFLPHTYDPGFASHHFQDQGGYDWLGRGASDQRDWLGRLPEDR
jgi:hypothetical protein